MLQNILNDVEDEKTKGNAVVNSAAHERSGSEVDLLESVTPFKEGSEGSIPTIKSKTKQMVEVRNSPKNSRENSESESGLFSRKAEFEERYEFYETPTKQSDGEDSDTEPQ